MSDTEIAIVGCGPKGLYALDSLCEAARRSPRHRFTVHIFEPSAYPGAGPIYDPRQPDVLLMNFPAGLISAWTGARGPSFMEWAARSPKPVDAGDYVPRALAGRYLFWSFGRVVAQAPSNVRLIRRKTPVDAVNRNGDQWHISPENIAVDHVLITTGHQDGFRHSATEMCDHIPSPFPIDQHLTQTAVPPASTVRCKGFALTFIDTMLALTEGRGGAFTLSGTGYNYAPSGQEPRRIAPFSRSGRPMRAKVEAALFTQPQDDAFWDERRAALSHILRTPNATFTHHIWPAFLSFTDEVLGNPSGTSAAFFTQRSKTTFTPDEIRQDLRIGYDIAMGRRAQDSAWALAEVWRRCYPQLINWISHRELTPDDAHHFRQIAAEMERLAFGPPAQNIGKLITLEQAGIVRFDHMSGDAGGDVTINARIPPAGGAALAAPLDGLLRDGHLSIGTMGGVRVDKDAHALTRDGTVKGLSVIGRATEGCVLGNDTLSRSLHDLPENWAAAVVQSAHQSNALEPSLMTIPQSIFSPCHGVVPLRPRLENWMAELLQDRPRLDALTDRFGAPLNIQSVDPFRRNIAQLTDCVTDYGLPFLPMFARKANKCLSYVQAARDMGIGIDTASHAEVEQCLEQGLPGDRIVCTAAVKDRALMTLCVGGGVTVILDNEDELELLEDVAEGATKPVSVGLRLNGFERDGTKLYSRFGFPLPQVPTLAARIATSETLRLDGLHFHLNGYSAEDRVAAILQTLPMIHKIKGDSTAPFFLDIGGGIPMNYLDDAAEWETWLTELDRALSGDRDPITQHNDGLRRKAGGEGKVDSYPVAQTLVQEDWMRRILDHMADGQTVAAHLRDAHISLRCEPGRSLLDGCGMTLARVAFCKRDSAATPVIGVQMNRTQSRSGFAEFALDPVMVPAPGPRKEAIEGYLAGTYCTESEWLTRRKMSFPQGVKAGDLMVFPNTAGYLMHFLESRSHQFPLARNVFVTEGNAGAVTLDDIDAG